MSCEELHFAAKGGNLRLTGREPGKVCAHNARRLATAPTAFCLIPRAPAKAALCNRNPLECERRPRNLRRPARWDIERLKCVYSRGRLDSGCGQTYTGMTRRQREFAALAARTSASKWPSQNKSDMLNWSGPVQPAEPAVPATLWSAPLVARRNRRTRSFPFPSRGALSTSLTPMWRTLRRQLPPVPMYSAHFAVRAIARGRANAHSVMLHSQGHRHVPAAPSLKGCPQAEAVTIKCHVCGAANAGTAQQCAKCGAPLKRRSDATRAGAPSPLPAPHHGGVALWWLWALGAVILIAIGVFAWMAFRSESYTAVVEAARWERTVEVLAFQPVEERAWKDELPAEAEVLECRDELVRTSDEPVDGAREVCGTPYAVDTGTGYANVMQDCEYQVFAPKCSYQTMQWVLFDTAVTSGEGFSPIWPQPAPEPDRKLGERSERYMCDILVDNKQYSFALEPENYALCLPQSRWRVQVNGLGSVVEATPEAGE